MWTHVRAVFLWDGHSLEVLLLFLPLTRVHRCFRRDMHKDKHCKGFHVTGLVSGPMTSSFVLRPSLSVCRSRIC